MEELKAEADKAIDEAFNEGYKAAVLEYAPQLESLRIKNEWLVRENKKHNLEKWTVPLWTCGGAFVGFMGGCGFSFLIRGNN